MNEENKEIIETTSENTEENFENLLEKAATSRAQRQKQKNKKTVRAVFISALCLVLALIIGLGSFVIMEICGTFNKGVSVNVTKGSSAYNIADELESSGAIKSAFLFRAYCKIKGYGSNFKFGMYKIEKGSSYKEIAEILSNQGEAAIVRVTIPEGTGIYDYIKDVNGNDVSVPGIATLLERAGVCTKQDFFDALSKVELTGSVLSEANKDNAYLPLEGYLFPDTYEFYAYDSKECALLAAKKMAENMTVKFTPEMVQRAGEINMSVNEVLTLASIIQMEAGNAGDAMPKVAAVFYNRLNRGEKLGSSPTCYYGNAFKNDDGRYDTYKVLGLPPGPLCSVGINAINSVLYPEENFNGYYYFVTDSSGKFYFHKTYNEQVNTINRLKRENKWIYEYLD